MAHILNANAQWDIYTALLLDVIALRKHGDMGLVFAEMRLGLLSSKMCSVLTHLCLG